MPLELVLLPLDPAKAAFELRKLGRCVCAGVPTKVVAAYAPAPRATATSGFMALAAKHRQAGSVE